ncbi:MAG: hypothetical protein KGL39_04210 [Patescibacteria group bacterium]|nr:hypothetical protein [Patescibacteria group bacterium]
MSNLPSSFDIWLTTQPEPSCDECGKVLINEGCEGSLCFVCCDRSANKHKCEQTDELTEEILIWSYQIHRVSPESRRAAFSDISVFHDLLDRAKVRGMV